MILRTLLRFGGSRGRDVNSVLLASKYRNWRLETCSTRGFEFRCTVLPEREKVMVLSRTSTKGMLATLAVDMLGGLAASFWMLRGSRIMRVAACRAWGVRSARGSGTAQPLTPW